MKKSNLFKIISTIIMTLCLMTGTAIAEDALFIDEDGNVGIGTTSPGHALDVNSGTDNVIASFSSADNDAKIRISDDTNSGYIQVKDSILSIGFSPVQTSNIVHLHYGNVGIGTTSPGQKLQIKSTAENYSDLDGDVHMRLTGDSNTAEYVDLSYDDDSNQAIFRLNAGSTYRRNPALVLDYYDPQFRFVVSPNNQQNVAMAIKTNGNVGIGDTTPSQKLDVAGNVRADDFIEYSNIYIGDALSEIENITYEKGTEKGDWADVDHSTLPEGLRVQTEETVWQNTETNERLYKGNPSENEIGDWIQTTEIVEGRSLGNSVQFNLQAIKQLLGKVLDAEDRVAELEAQIVDLQKQLVELKR